MRAPDLPAILLGIALAPTLLLAPGYVWSRLLELGPVSRPERLAWSLVLSLATTPILAYLFFLAVPYNTAAIRTFALLAAAAPAVLARLLGVSKPATAARAVRLGPLWLLPALMVFLVLSSVIDLEWGNHLYRGSAAGDYAKHVIVTDSIHRTGVHPANPAFHPGQPIPLFFYFFWFLLCSLLDGLSGWRLGPLAAVQAMTAWSVLALFAVTLLLIPPFFGRLTRRRVAICFGLLFATGLDLAGVLFRGLVDIQPGRISRHAGFYLHPDFTADWWNWLGQVASWFQTAAFVPHHLAALVVSMTGVLLATGLSPPSRPWGHWMRALVFAAAAASSLGLSVWVTLVFAVFWAAWALLGALRGRRYDLGLLVRAALPALLMATPLIWILSHARLDTRSPLVLDVRDFSPWQVYRLGLDPARWQHAIDLLWLVPVYFLEFGIFFLGGVFWWRRHRRPLAGCRLAATGAGAVGLVLGSFLLSNIQFNDFGWRSMLPAQLALLLATAWMIERLLRLRRRPCLVAGCLALGITTIVPDWLLATGHSAAVDLRSNQGAQGRRNFAMKRFYEQIRRATPSHSIVQHNPQVLRNPDHALYAHRQTVALDRLIGAVFATQGPRFDHVITELGSIFAAGASAGHIEELARRYGIGLLVLNHTDAGWNSPVWNDTSRFRLVAECEYARAYEPLRR